MNVVTTLPVERNWNGQAFRLWKADEARRLAWYVADPKWVSPRGEVPSYLAAPPSHGKWRPSTSMLAFHCADDGAPTCPAREAPYDRTAPDAHDPIERSWDVFQAVQQGKATPDYAARLGMRMLNPPTDTFAGRSIESWMGAT